MTSVTPDKFEKIIKKSTCPKGCRCYANRPEDLCKARKTGVDSLLECLEDNPDDCTFSIQFGGAYYCKCQTRIELAKLLEGD